MADPGGPPRADSAMACEVCGRAVATWPARYCHWCGAALGVDVVELGNPSGVIIDGDERPGRSRLGVVLAVAAVAALVGLVIFSGGSGPEPEETAAEPTIRAPATATPAGPAEEPPSASQTSLTVEMEPLAWAGGSLVTTGVPVLVTRLADEWLVLATIDEEPDPTTGVHAFVSSDGFEWTELGNVIPGLRSLHAASAADGTAIVAGEDADGAMVISVSDDARTWVTTELPLEAAATPARTSISAVTVVDGTIVAATASSLDPRDALVERFPELDQHVSRFGFSTSGPPFTVTIEGPLGLPLFTATADDLGLDDQAAQAMFNDLGQQDDAIVWALEPDGAWGMSKLPDTHHVTAIVPDGDGGLLATGWGVRSGPHLWATADGEGWTRLGGDIQRVVRWNETTVGLDVRGRLERRTTETADGWVSMGLGEHLDSRDWFPVTVSAGEGGLAVVVQEFATRFEQEQGGPTRGVLVQDGFTLTVDVTDASLRITDRDGQLAVEARLFDARPQAGIAADLTANEVRFSDPETGSPIAAFDLDDLADLERALRDGTIPPFDHTVAITTDGATWSVQSDDEISGSDGLVTQVAVADATVLALAQDPDVLFGGPAGDLMVWVAPLPDPG